MSRRPPDMTPERWRQVSGIFHEALAREPGAREGYLAGACQADASLRADVDALLAAHREASRFGEGGLAALAPEHWEEIGALYRAACDAAAVDRAAVLDRLAPALRVVIETLLSRRNADASGASFGAGRLPDLTAAIPPGAGPGLPTPPAPAAATRRLAAGTRLGPYVVTAPLGAGGMGEVYQAHDTRLDRTVAIKVLPPDLARDAEARQRLEREARATAALAHPHICTLLDIGRHDDIDFLVMEYLEGETLARRLGRGTLPLETALTYGIEIARALAAAHRAGIIHRDLKPGNVMITAGGAKLLDFGLAKRRPSTQAGNPTVLGPRLEPLTHSGMIVGTIRYMAPEQLQGSEADERTDVFACGAVLYEMLTGRRAFEGTSDASLIGSILHTKPPAPSSIDPTVPAVLDDIVRACLQKDPAARYQRAADVVQALESVAARRSWAGSMLHALRRRLRQPRARLAVGAAVGLAVLATAAGQAVYRHFEARAVRDRVIPEIHQLIEKRDYVAAFLLAQEGERVLRRDALLERLWPQMSRVISVHTEPSGADVYWTDYGAPDAWQYLGTSPLHQVRIPVGFFRWRVEAPGFEPLHVANSGTPASDWPPGDGSVWKVSLARAGSVPSSMVHVDGEDFHDERGEPVHLEPFLIDKHEVTNRQFKEFLDSGGYHRREYWSDALVTKRGAVSWDAAIAVFHDQTGRPGPSTWESGSVVTGEDDFPVGGVSWYEADAYCRFAGKSLPTIYHWFKAAGLGAFSHVLAFSNFEGRGPVQVGSSRALGFFGTYDMGGNVKEWCANANGDHRYILGGAWNEPPYMLGSPDARPASDRSPTNGFRCVTYASPTSVPAVLTEDVRFRGHAAATEILISPVRQIFTLARGSVRDYARVRPVPDHVFQLYRSFYAYDPRPLNPAIELVDEDSGAWKKERVTFDAAYGTERVIATLLLPRNTAPPYQTVVYFPHLGAVAAASSEHIDDVEMRWVDFILKSGRALMLPVYKGTYERRVPPPQGAHAARDLAIEQVKDLNRSVDYLLSRTDIDHERLAYYGFSWGGTEAPRLLAMEKRLRVAILLGGGFDPTRKDLPEVDVVNFAPRVDVPVLMVNGRYDFLVPVDTAQIPLFRLFGTPGTDKRHVVLDTGHVPPRTEFIRELLLWLDRYLGPPARSEWNADAS